MAVICLWLFRIVETSSFTLQEVLVFHAGVSKFSEE